MRLNSFLALALPLILLSCAAYVGPIKEPNFEQNLRDLTTLNEEPYLLVGRAYWHNKPSFWSPKYEEGIIVLQETRLSFLEWSTKDNNYKTCREVCYSDIKGVKYHVWEESQRVDIETEYGVTEGFSIITSDGVAYNGAETSRAQGIIREKMLLNQE
ncbi:MAG: hypothetical protein GY941_19420 [Planctomycetes bacterium]|nr:hypothetical protein [Planctomycetota bacterium]